MKLDNICEGLIVKNYKEMCSLLDEPIKGGDSKKSQLKEWDRYFEYHKDGNKFIIDEIYSECKVKDDNRSYGNNRKRKRFNRLKMNRQEQDSKGIYAIYDKNNNIYVGSTIQTYRDRFHQHKSKSNTLPTYEMLSTSGNNAVMIPLFIMNDIKDEELIRMVENEFIKYYIMQPDWNVINRQKSYRAKSEFKRIKIKEYNYIQALQLLAKNGLIDESEVVL